MTRDDMVTSALLLYNEPSTSSAIATADWQAFNTSIYQEVCRDCRAYPDNDVQPTANTQRTYMIPVAFAGIRDGGVYHATAGQLKGPVTMEELSLEVTLWRASTGTPTHWYFADEVVTVSTSTNWAIGLHPVPTAVANLTLSGWSVPAALSASAIPSIPTGHHDTIVWGMCYRAAVRDMDRTGRNLPKLNFFRDEYLGRKQALLQNMIDFGMEGWPLAPPHTLKTEGAR